jgi:hypothetical protein
MPTYRLTPLPGLLWHAAWMASQHNGPCLVSADSEEEARRLARRRFLPFFLPPYAGDPWARKDMVQAEAEGRCPTLPAGTVLPVTKLLCAPLPIGKPRRARLLPGALGSVGNGPEAT